MNTKLLNLIGIATLLGVLQAKAQTPADALRLSYFNQGNGTARTMGIGGAIGALGADFSAASVNPAGMAAFRTSELIFTPGYNIIKTNATLSTDTPNKNPLVGDTKTGYYLNNTALVLAFARPKHTFKTHNFSIGFNRLANFNSSFYYKGQNKAKSSIVNRFRDQANSNVNSLNQFESQLAYEAGAIYFLKDGDTQMISDLQGVYENNLINQSQQGETSGRINELLLSYATNYKEKVFLGATLGIPYMKFYDNKIYKESDAGGTNEIAAFESLRYNENLAVTGNGINLRLGAIVKLTQNARVGLAMQTPNRYKLGELYTTQLQYVYTEQGKRNDNSAASPDGQFNYTIRTPWRWTASGAYLFQKKGFLSADVEYTDYTQMGFEYALDYKEQESSVNAEIKNNYTNTWNLRLGGEAVLDIFRLRAGIATMGLPVKTENSDYFKDATKVYTFGAGLRQKRFYLDLAYQTSKSSNTLTPYYVSNDVYQPSVARTTRYNQMVATLGFKF